jgi:HEAT repeat protein
MLQRARRADPGASGEPGPRPADIAQLLADLPTHIANFYSTDLAVVHEAALRVRDLMAVDKNPPTDELIAHNVIPALMHALNLPKADIQFEAAWSLTNIASGKPEHTRAVVDGGAIPVLVRLLGSEALNVREQSVWALGNIAGDNAAYRDTILELGALDTLLGICHMRGKIGMLRNATWSLSNLCRGHPAPNFAVVSRALPTLRCMVNFYDHDVVADACWALTYLTDSNAIGDEETAQVQIQAIIEGGIVPRVVELLSIENIFVVTPALRVVGNLATGSDLQTDMLLQCQILPALLQLMNSPRRGIRKEACWTVSNITAGPVEQIDQVMQANIFPTLIQFLRCKEYDVRKEATWAITNAIASRHEPVIRYLVNYAVIAPLAELLDPSTPEPRVLSAILDALNLILTLGASDVAVQRQAGRESVANAYAEHLEHCDRVGVIADLQRHADPHVASLAHSIIDSFYRDDDEDAVTAAAAAASGGFNFDPEHAVTKDETFNF